MEKYICIHGHFYQPPRENPWLEAIEAQESAYPYHDWNERVTAESYAPNGMSRILDPQGFITRIVNNYARISYNFGPTLLSWMEEKEPQTYRAVFEADQMSRERFSGHGSAMAQVYNHLIMPLANSRDKYTQVAWGIADFESRFGRKPEGMWLAETAVDLESLDIMAQQGIKFTILAPHQVRAVRPKGAANWNDLTSAGVDPTQAYEVVLPSGRRLAVFFYDGPISRAIAFERLLEKGEFLVNRLMGAFNETRQHPQLVHIATDGETYGHHHRYGDMALAYAIHQLESTNQAKLTNYGEFLEKFPPTHEAQILENTSWSCAHGVERWRSNCGCNSGGHPGWHQQWRAPLREALDWLRDATAPLFEQSAREILKDPWSARNDYIDVVLDRSPEKLETFLGKHAARELNEMERTRVWKLLEMERQAMLMYTSCGWFFDELSGIETVQVIQYAGRAIQLAGQLFGRDFEAPFLQRLEKAPSNLPDLKDGRGVFEKFVKPSEMDLSKVGAHYAISSVFANGIEESKNYCYTIDYEEYKSFSAGRARLVVGTVRVTSDVTQESEPFTFSILHLGDHNLSGAIRPAQEGPAHAAMVDDLTAAFKRADFTETIRAMDRHFGAATYSLKSLFRDEQRRIVRSILESTLEDAEDLVRQIYENNAPLMRFLSQLAIPLPRALGAAAQFSVNQSIRGALESEEIDTERITQLFNEAKEIKVTLDSAGLGYVFQGTLGRITEQLWSDPEDLNMLRHLSDAVGLVSILPFEVNLWSVQNNYYELAQKVAPEIRRRAEERDELAQAWIRTFIEVGEKLRVRVGP